MNRLKKELLKHLDKIYKNMRDKEIEEEFEKKISNESWILSDSKLEFKSIIKEKRNLDPSDYWLDKVRIQNPDIYKLIDQLIKEGKNQGYKISVTIE